MVGNFKKKPIIQFLWGELPEARRRQTFAKAGPIIFLIEGSISFVSGIFKFVGWLILFSAGLSHLVAASYTEDKYGVVQKDLPDILSMMLDLQGVCFFNYLSIHNLKKKVSYLGSWNSRDICWSHAKAHPKAIGNFHAPTARCSFEASIEMDYKIVYL